MKIGLPLLLSALFLSSIAASAENAGTVQISCRYAASPFKNCLYQNRDGTTSTHTCGYKEEPIFGQELKELEHGTEYEVVEILHSPNQVMFTQGRIKVVEVDGQERPEAIRYFFNKPTPLVGIVDQAVPGQYRYQLNEHYIMSEGACTMGMSEWESFTRPTRGDVRIQTQVILNLSDYKKSTILLNRRQKDYGGYSFLSPSARKVQRLDNRWNAECRVVTKIQ